MEVHVHGTEGLPEDAVLSVRAGQTRRQAPVAQLDRPLLFPSLPLNANPVKIDILQPVGSHRMEIAPEDCKYDVKIGDAISLSFSVKESPHLCGKPSSELRGQGLSRSSTTIDAEASTASTKKKLQSAIEGREYLDDHNLFKYVQEMLKYIIKEKPADPYDFMISYMAKHRKTPAAAPPQGTAPAALAVAATPPAPAVPAAPVTPQAPKPESQRPIPPQVKKAVPGEPRPPMGIVENQLREQSKACLEAALKNGWLDQVLDQLPPDEKKLKANVAKSLADGIDSGELEKLLATRTQPAPVPAPAPVLASPTITTNEAELKATVAKFFAVGLNSGALEKALPPAPAGAAAPAPAPALADPTLATSEAELKATIAKLFAVGLTSGALEKDLPPAPAGAAAPAAALADPTLTTSEAELKATVAKLFAVGLNSGALEKALPPAPALATTSVPEANVARTSEECLNSDKLEKALPAATPMEPAPILAPNDAEKFAMKAKIVLEEGLISGMLSALLCQAQQIQANMDPLSLASKDVEVLVVRAKESTRAKLEESLRSGSLDAILKASTPFHN